MEIGASGLRRKSSDWTNHLAASISLSIAETAAVCDGGVCVMVWDRLCPDWRRVNRSESMDKHPFSDHVHSSVSVSVFLLLVLLI